MQALRVCSRSVARPLVAGAPLRVRAVATGALSQSASDPNPARATGSVIPLSNVEAQWEKFSAEEQAQVYTQLEEITKKDWKTLSIDEKKAGTYTVHFTRARRVLTVCVTCVAIAFRYSSVFSAVSSGVGSGVRRCSLSLGNDAGI